MAIPEHGIGHKVRPIRTYTREERDDLADRFTVDQCHEQVERIKRELAEYRAKRAKHDAHDPVEAALHSSLKEWVALANKATARLHDWLNGSPSNTDER